MQIHEIQPKNKTKDRKRVGRGGKKGTFSGRGCKGQKSRAGRKMQPFMRELIKRYPKIRGYRQESRTKGIVALNLDIVEKNFQSGDKITPAILLEKNMINKLNGKAPKVKILSRGEITKAFNFEGCLASKAAQVKIEKEGGSIK
ncbi:MAG: 50S ribosomal protein L15 [Candidatus Pacebacteria bacterium]|nr:50S ribosomal protein L15 [Candidatus Paceibacterota bacterium]